VRVAYTLHEKSNRLAGGTQCLKAAKTIVTENVKWLQPKRLSKDFDWPEMVRSMLKLPRLLDFVMDLSCKNMN
jgi:hypothetical protein